jgi:hypothetical protein
LLRIDVKSLCGSTDYDRLELMSRKKPVPSGHDLHTEELHRPKPSVRQLDWHGGGLYTVKLGCPILASSVVKSNQAKRRPFVNMCTQVVGKRSRSFVIIAKRLASKRVGSPPVIHRYSGATSIRSSNLRFRLVRSGMSSLSTGGWEHIKQLLFASLGDKKKQQVQSRDRSTFVTSHRSGYFKGSKVRKVARS